MTDTVVKEGQKALVIIGGSYGGVSTAHYLLKHVLPRLPAKPSYQVVLVSSAAKAMCRPACPRALISDDMFDQNKLFVDISKQFESYTETEFRFIHGTASHLDHAHRNLSVNLADGDAIETISFQALVIATGASTPSPLLSLHQTGAEDGLRNSWAIFREALASAKSIIIAGGGPAGVETAGELGEFLNGRPGFFATKLVSPKVKITIVTAASQLLPGLRPTIAKKAEALLSKVGVSVIYNCRVQSTTPPDAGTCDSSLTAGATVTLDDGVKLEADLYIPTTGTIPNTSFVDKALLNPDGRVQTNASTLRVEGAGLDARIYAIGDASSWARPAIHNILGGVPVLCANIRRDLLLAAGSDAGGEDRVFKEDVREMQLVPIGKSKGVGAAMGWRLPSFLVWLIKGRDYWLWTTGDLWSGKQWAKEAV